MRARSYLLVILAFSLLSGWQAYAAAAPPETPAFPPPLAGYADPPNASLLQVLQHRIHAAPFNLVCTLIFFAAIVHTFMAPLFLRLSHLVERRHRRRLAVEGIPHSHGGGFRDE